MQLGGVWPKSTRVEVLTSDATRRRVAEEHADGMAPGVGRDPASETAQGPRDTSRAHASAAPGMTDCQ